jgi:steroid 5-alpha reductase family enzyme
MGCRLTWNFWRKGGYSGGEDYRWSVIRKWFPGWKFEFFNLVFICFAQHAVFCAQISPAALALNAENTDLNLLDLIATAIFGN